MNIRAWTEVAKDIFSLLWTALSSAKGIELLDELAQALGLPDFFPNVDGSAWDDSTKPTTAPSQPTEQARRPVGIQESRR